MKSNLYHRTWKEFNDILPKEFQINYNRLPVESYWDWKGNQIHVERYPNPEAEFRIFLHHGVGTNARQLIMIAGHRLAEMGYEVVAIDNLGYGLTEVRQPDVTYSDWVNCLVDFVNHENLQSPKKTILYGLSAGGMLCYNAACFLDQVEGIVGMCFLKNDDKTVGKVTAKFGWANGLVLPLMKFFSQTPFKRLPIPMKWVSKMNALVNDPKALKILLKDKTSAGASVQLQFLYEYMSYPTPIPVNEFDKCPILLTQPEKDRWTPLFLSEISMKNIRAPFQIKILENGSHLPIEKTALEQLTAAIDDFIQSTKAI